MFIFRRGARREKRETVFGSLYRRLVPQGCSAMASMWLMAVQSRLGQDDGDGHGSGKAEVSERIDSVIVEKVGKRQVFKVTINQKASD